MLHVQQQRGAEDGYGGDYIKDIAADVVAKRPDALNLPADECQEAFRELGVELMFASIKQSLHDFGTDFDVYTHEDSMHTSGRVDQAIAKANPSAKLPATDIVVVHRSDGSGTSFDPTGPMLLKAGLVEGNTGAGVLASGQVAGIINDLPSCAELVEKIDDGFGKGLDAAQQGHHRGEFGGLEKDEVHGMIAKRIFVKGKKV